MKSSTVYSAKSAEQIARKRHFCHVMDNKFCRTLTYNDSGYLHLSDSIYYSLLWTGVKEHP